MGQCADCPAGVEHWLQWLVDAEERCNAPPRCVAPEAPEPLSALVDGWGYWSLNLPLRDCADVKLQLKAIGSGDREAELTLSSCNAQPAPPLVIRERNAVGVYLPLVLR